MTKWNFLLILINEYITMSKQSIAGVTYMDDFDFEDRYRNVHECDPKYWHPLHLPTYCVNMYEKLIRTGLSRGIPMTIVKHKADKVPFDLENVYTYDHNYDSEDIRHRKGNRKRKSYYKTLKYDLPSQEAYYPDLEIVNGQTADVMYGKNIMDSYSYPYQRMLDALRKDVANDPPKPTIEVIPNLGPVVLYQQPISRKSEMVIKEVAAVYQKANEELLRDHKEVKNEYEIIANSDGQDLLAKTQPPTTLRKVVKPGSVGKSNNNVQRKTIVKNNMVAIFEKKNLSG